jgi:hypothetical protein
MVEEEKSQKVVETYKAVAAGIASVLAAVFTSRLGVAGTLVGTAMAAVLITLGSALLKVQLMKATNKISGLPDTVRGRLSTQQIRIPGRPNAEPNPELAADPEAADDRSPGLLARLRAMPGFLRDLPSNQRRKMLVAGLLLPGLVLLLRRRRIRGVIARVRPLHPGRLFRHRGHPIGRSFQRTTICAGEQPASTQRAERRARATGSRRHTLAAGRHTATTRRTW